MDAICSKGVTFMLLRDGYTPDLKLKECIYFETNPKIESDTKVINLGTMKLNLTEFKEEYIKEINSSAMLCSMMKQRIEEYNNLELKKCAKKWHSYALFEKEGKPILYDITEKFKNVLTLLDS